MKRIHVDLMFGHTPIKGTITIAGDDPKPIVQEEMFSGDKKPSEKQEYTLRQKGFWRDGMSAQEAWMTIKMLKDKEEELKAKAVSNGTTPIFVEYPQPVKRGRGRPRKEKL